MRWPWSTPESTPVATIDPEVDAQPIVAVEPVAEVKEPVPVPQSGPSRKPGISSEEMQEYMRVSTEVGIDCCTDLTREKLLACFREENIHVFNMKQVVAYLDDNLGEDWQWRGLRTVDAAHMPGGSWSHEVGKRKIFFAGDVYRGAVPLPVLLTVQKIQKAVPEVFFYVSARKNEDGDPFLAVTNRWLGCYVVERWDEPNFRER